MLREIGRVAVFLICAQTLLHFRAKESYEKYIKLVISMMLLVLLAGPFLNLFSGSEKKDITQLIEKYERGMKEQSPGSYPDMQDVEEVLKSLAGQAVAVTEEQKTTDAEEVSEEITGEIYSEKIVIEQIEIGEKDGIFE